MPNPRLTGLGGGLFCGALMFALGCLDQLLFGASLTVYGVLFLPVCVVTAVWIRRGDLLTAPIVVPIAFAVGLLPVAESGQGISGRLMGLFTALATQAGWLYGGTLVSRLDRDRAEDSPDEPPVHQKPTARLTGPRPPGRPASTRSSFPSPRASPPPRSPRCSAAAPGRSPP